MLFTLFVCFLEPLTTPLWMITWKREHFWLCNWLAWILTTTIGRLVCVCEVCSVLSILIMSVFGEGILSPHCYEAPSVICMMVILLVPRPLDVVMDETDSAVVPHILSEQAIKIIIINDNDDNHTILPFSPSRRSCTTTGGSAWMSGWPVSRSRGEGCHVWKF